MGLRPWLTCSKSILSAPLFPVGHLHFEKRGQCSFTKNLYLNPYTPKNSGNSVNMSVMMAENPNPTEWLTTAEAAELAEYEAVIPLHHFRQSPLPVQRQPETPKHNLDLLIGPLDAHALS